MNKLELAFVWACCALFAGIIDYACIAAIVQRGGIVEYFRTNMFAAHALFMCAVINVIAAIVAWAVYDLKKQ